MEEFDINEIELEDKNEPEVTELLTGSVVKGLDPNSPVKSNVEVEKNEYLQFPDGVTQKVIGDTHEKGGVKMNIPDGTKIISDSLKLNAQQVKKLKADYDLDVSTKDTYANVMDKYIRKIGLAKLDEEQEEAFKLLEKVMDKGTDANTTDVNKQYISGKIFDIEKKKEGKEKEKSSFFNVVFDMQEGTKPDKVKNDEGFKYGGISQKNFEAVCKKFNITPEQGMKMFEKGGTFADGGEVGDTLTEAQQKEVKEKWNGDVQAYLAYQKTKQALTSNPEFVQDLYNTYKEKVSDPKAYTSEKVRGYEQGLKGRSQEEVVNQLLEQEERNARLAAYGFDASETDQKSYKNNVNRQAYELIQRTPGLSDLKDEKAFEKGYVGQAAYLAYDDLMKSDKYKNSFVIGQTGVADERGNTTISGIDNANTNTTLGQRLNYNIAAVPPISNPAIVAPRTEEEQAREVATGTNIKDNVILPTVPRGPRLFFTPDQSTLPPTPMEAHYKPSIRLQRIDPVRIGIEQNIQSIADQRQFVADQLSEIPDSQRASALASLLATSQKSTNEAISTANVTNAQNEVQAELFNIQQAGQEQLYDANNALNYEQRQLTAKSKTEEMLRRYYDYNRKVNINNFQNQQRLNLMDSLFPDFNLDFMGASVNYDPNSQWNVQDRTNYLQSLALTQNPYIESQI